MKQVTEYKIQKVLKCSKTFRRNIRLKWIELFHFISCSLNLNQSKSTDYQ